MINKDVTHPRMRRHIKNPRIVLLDSSLEYKKGESQVRFLAPHLTVGVRVRLPMSQSKGSKETCLSHACSVSATDLYTYPVKRLAGLFHG